MIYESGLHGEAVIDPKPVGGGQNGPSEQAAVGEDRSHNLREEGGEFIGRRRRNKPRNLVPGRGVRPGGHHAQQHVDGQGRED